MEERVQKIIAAAGIASRRAAEEMILEGRVKVNGALVTELGTKADPNKDHIKVDGKLINPQQPQTYVMLNKPVGYVTTMSDPEKRPVVSDLLKGVRTRVYPVGRLDYNTEGLLLLTNDGDFAHLVTHPRHELPKTYLVKIKGVLEDRDIDNLERGVFLKDGKTAPARVRRLRKEEANSWVEITIHEGRKRQVRRMIDHTGKSVIKLKRTRIGSLDLGDLPLGTYRHLTADEVKVLRDAAQGAEGAPENKRTPDETVSVPSGPAGAKRQLTFIEGPKKKERTRPAAVPRRTGDGYPEKRMAEHGAARRPGQSGARPEAQRARPDARTGRPSFSRAERPEGRKPWSEKGPAQKPFGGTDRSSQSRAPRTGEGFKPREGRFFGSRTSSQDQRGPRPGSRRPWSEKGPARKAFGDTDRSYQGKAPRTGEGFRPREGQGRSFGSRAASPAQRGGRSEGKRPWSDKRSGKAPFSRPEASSAVRGARSGEGSRLREGQGRSFGGRAASPGQRGARPEGRRPWSENRSERPSFSRPEGSSAGRGARTGGGFRPRGGQGRSFGGNSGSSVQHGERPEGRRSWQAAKPAARSGSTGSRPGAGAQRTSGPKTGWARPGNDRSKKGGSRRRS